MKIVDEPTRDAFHRLAKAYGTQADLAKALGCSLKHVNAILNSKVHYVRDSFWRKAEPLLRSHIEPLDAKRQFLKGQVHLLTDEEVDQLVLQIVARGGSAQ